MLLDRPHQPLEPLWLRKRIRVEERQPVAVRDSRRGDVVAGGEPDVVVECDQFDSRLRATSSREPSVLALSTTTIRSGRPTLLRESGKRGSQVGAGIPIDDENRNAHGIIIPRAVLARP